MSQPTRDFAGRDVVVVAVSAPAGTGFVPPAAGLNLHLGAACARLFAARGARVWAIAPDAAALQALKAEIAQAGGVLQGITADVADFEALARAAEQVAQTAGAVHVLVNAHAHAEPGGIAASSAASWERVIRADLLGPVFASKAFLPLLKRATGAAIVHIGSIDGLLGNPGIPSYSAAKGGLVPLTHVMAHEFAAHGIRVNCVARAMTAAAGAPVHPRFAPLVAQTPLGRPGWPEEVAEAVCFLASSAASYINGVVLPVDGGRIGITQGTQGAA